jgi:DtxR family Mn-dependent transcriptional regulator
MNAKQDEYLEALWRLKEQNKDSIQDLQTVLDIPIEDEVIGALASDSLAVFDRENKAIALTEEGEVYARDLVRKHRLAERLLHDVLRMRDKNFETEACAFEHLLAPQVVEGICTLLGHPRRCPHGLPIPEGDCCRRSEVKVNASVVSLTSFAVGETGQIAYINCQNDAQLHRLNGLQLKPGVEITLHQKYPACVVECEDGMIAVDDLIADNICLWKKPKTGRLSFP